MTEENPVPIHIYKYIDYFYYVYIHNHFVIEKVGCDLMILNLEDIKKFNLGRFYNFINL